MSATPEPRSFLSAPAFSGADIDRVAEIRHDADAVARLLEDREVLALACDHADVLVEAGGTRLARRPWSGDPADAVLLGVQDGHPLVAVALDTVSDPGDARPMSLREAGGALVQSESGLAAYLSALSAWHRRHPFCAVCGHATQVTEAGLSRKCPNCGATHFPRTDPVVIMTVVSDAGLLMGSRNGWDPHRYSVLAGFVSSGEAPEEAVVREVQEESGIICRDPVYIGAQPWPFPSNLMLGFHALADGGDPAPGGDGELSDVRWFPREEVILMQQGESDLALPPEVSIARLLIDRWVADA